MKLKRLIILAVVPLLAAMGPKPEGDADGHRPYVRGEVPAARIEPLLTVAIERFAMEKSRRDELRETRERLAERQVVEKAKGILMKARAVPEDQAHRLLREYAMQNQKRLGEAAREIVEMSQWLNRA